MKILAIADEESKSLWDFFDRSKLEGVDLIISCGDLDPRYLSFLVTLSNVTVLYVHGNHDGKYETVPPEGCICIEDQVYVHMAYGRQHKRYDKYQDTHIINAYEKCVFEFEDDDPQENLY